MNDAEIVDLFNRHDVKCDYCGKEGILSEIILVPIITAKGIGKMSLDSRCNNYMPARKCEECKKKQKEYFN